MFDWKCFSIKKYLCELDQNKMFELSQVGCVGLVLDGPLVVDLGQELGLLDVRVEVKRVVPILKRKNCLYCRLELETFLPAFHYAKQSTVVIKMQRFNKLVFFLHRVLRYFNKSFI
jgi:hypothetical protein